MTESLPHSNELESMFISDQKDRKDWKEWTPEKNERDNQRLAKTLKLIEEKVPQTGKDYYHAAMVLQHGDKTEHYKLANELCQKAISLGEEKAKWLYAATLDRYMLSSGEKYQKYGTQYKKDENGWYHCSVDPRTTDKERIKYNVPTLDELKTRVDELNS